MSISPALLLESYPMNNKKSPLPLFFALAIVLLALLGTQITGSAAPVAPTAAISLSSPYSQNFDTLSNTGTTNTWADDTTISGYLVTKP